MNGYEITWGRSYFQLLFIIDMKCLFIILLYFNKCLCEQYLEGYFWQEINKYNGDSNYKYNLKLMDPNVNRNSMGSRAGTAFKNNLGGVGGIGAPSRLGTAGRVF